MKQKELGQIKITHKHDCWDDFNLSNKSIYETVLKNKIVNAKTLIKEIECFCEEYGIYEITPDFDAKKFDYSEKCKNKKFQKFCDYFRKYIEHWIRYGIESQALKGYAK